MFYAPITKNKSASSSMLLCACSNCGWDNFCESSSVCFRAGGFSHCSNGLECYGCFDKQIASFKCQMPNVDCCNQTDFCNFNMLNKSANRGADKSIESYLLTGVASVSLVACLIILYLSYWNQRKSASNRMYLNDLKSRIQKSALKPVDADYLKTQPVSRTLSTDDTGSPPSINSTSSGMCQAELMARTISCDIRVDHSAGMLGQGRFGSVWPGDWNGDRVAVKEFISMHELSWAHEVEIYQTCMLRHENILGFIAADIKQDTGRAVKMLLVTDYHPNGSLYDYLRANLLSKDQLSLFLYTTCKGLSHLHGEIVGTHYKPAIAHRDLKSKNILVKRNFECCLADFGLSVRYSGQLNRLDCGACGDVNVHQGSVRYMAPECLANTINTSSIDNFKKCDIYAFALVIWECLSRLKLRESDQVKEYMPPYSEHVQGNPSVADMMEVVCSKQMRPTHKAADEQDLRELVELMNECWADNASGRLNTLAIKKKFKRIFSNLDFNQ